HGRAERPAGRHLLAPRARRRSRRTVPEVLGQPVRLPCSASTAADRADHSGGAQSPNSRSVSTAHATPASGSTHRNVPDPPKCPKVRGEPSGAVQWGAFVPLSSKPSPHGL